MILISIYPEFADLIKKGIKKYEFRKVLSKRTRNNLLKEKYMAIYETAPTSAVTIIFKVGEIFEDRPTSLWSRFAKDSGLKRDYFMYYYKNKGRGLAIEIKDVIVLNKPLTIEKIRKLYPNFMPPQNFYNLSKEVYPLIFKELNKHVR